jgi:hypothetical protein
MLILCYVVLLITLTLTAVSSYKYKQKVAATYECKTKFSVLQ